jgi:hypothetical protein
MFVNLRSAVRFVALASIVVSGSAFAQAGSNAPQARQPTPEQRQTMKELHEKMADMHAKMASCLGSNKPFTECRQVMIDACQSSGGACPMPLHGGMGRGRRGGRMGGPGCDWMLDPGELPDQNSAPAKK